MTFSGFTLWLTDRGIIDTDEAKQLSIEWRQFRDGLAPLKVYDAAPRTLTAFVARKYPKEFIVYQSYLRLTQGTKQ